MTVKGQKLGESYQVVVPPSFVTVQFMLKVSNKSPIELIFLNILEGKLKAPTWTFYQLVICHPILWIRRELKIKVTAFP